MSDARRQLGYLSFDVVLSEHRFTGKSTPGQDLLDDLRRRTLLPFSTIFSLLPAEATDANHSTTPSSPPK